ncbi:2-amino-4-hydroxy-6-hydroxymethyldihydropteridine diphosphokinase [Aquimarina rhabdastrellae]
MRELYFVHISLGSNVGDRFKNLQKAVDAIYTQIGDVVSLSTVYQTPAWGFSSDDFYNACISIKSFYTTEEILRRLLKIEEQLGRIRTDASGYEPRTIDLDIIFSSEIIQSSDTLTVPHPAMQDRKFVLQPLSEIAAEYEHPKLKYTVAELLERTIDDAVITPVQQQLQNPKQQYNLSQYQYLTIEGNIGAGKTSLSTIISQEYNAKLVLERFADNPFLPKFYEDRERYAFPLEMSFLADRYRQLNDDISQYDLFKDFIVSDYDVFKSLIFASVTLHEEEYTLYKKLFDIMYKDMVKPSLYVYMYQNTERLLQNIKKRGRAYEQRIPADYLDKINQGYLQFIKTQQMLNVKIVDISEKDFIANREDYIWLLEQILE